MTKHINAIFEPTDIFDFGSVFLKQIFYFANILLNYSTEANLEIFYIFHLFKYLKC